MHRPTLGHHHALCRWCRRYVGVGRRAPVKRQVRRLERRTWKKEVRDAAA